MEVHHPHHPTHKKKWSEYLLEFFMLFFAVTLGFFAENIREGISENHKKKELLAAVVHDLKTDKEEIQRHRMMVKNRIANCNNFLKILEKDYKEVDKLDFYRTAILHAENKDLILNEKARNDAEAKGYFSSEGLSEISVILNKFNYHYNDYKEVNLGCLESCKKYINTIVPDLLESKLVHNSDFIWTNSISNSKEFEGKLNKPIDKKLANLISFDIWFRKALLTGELINFDALDQNADKAIKIIEKEIKE